jgi:DNA topoisomerase-6 subunit B
MAKRTAKKTAKKAVKKTAKKAAAKTVIRKTTKKAAVKRAKVKSGKSTQPSLFDSPAPAEAAPSQPAPAAETKTTRRGTKYATAESMAKAQRSISVSEFFAKNRHLLGFDNPRKALLTSVKEAVDNALDACEEAGILPVVHVAIRQVSETHFVVSVQDNGPGIVKQQIPNIFGKLLYGSKFHRLRMSRGQQGIGISAAGMYGLLTTGQPIRITSRTGKRAQAHYYELKIDTRKNKPEIITDDVVEWDGVAHGTLVEIELEAKYQRGRQSVDEYLSQTAIANPHVTFHYTAPDGRDEDYPASVKSLPAVPKEVKPHPHGVELGVLIKMLQETRARSVQQFLTSEFSRVTPRVAKEIINTAGNGITEKTRPSRIDGGAAKAIYHAIAETKIMAPSTDCVVPIGEEQLIHGLKQVVEAEFYTAVSRRPAVYRGNPFVIEAAIAYGKKESKDVRAERLEKEIEGEDERDNGNGQLAKVMRLANRVPLQYQQGACAIHKSVVQMSWKKYGLSQSRGALPTGDLAIVVHMGSVWVPFTSESKEAIASYPEILKDIRLALQECGRKLGIHIRKTVRMRQELKKRNYIEKYIPAVAEALRDILDLKDRQVKSVCNNLKDVLERSRKF